MKNALLSVLAAIAVTPADRVIAEAPQYSMVNLGIVGESNSGAEDVSTSGVFATGFTDNSALLWQNGSGSTSLASEPTRPFNQPQAVNDAGVVVGIGATTFFGSSALPLVWQNGVASVLPLPPGQTLGRAYGINNANLAVGSVNGGTLERAATYELNGSGSVLTQTLNGGSLITAFDINNAGRIVGFALDPDNAAVTKGYYLDNGDNEATDIGALSGLGHNSALAFAVSSNGLVAGTSSLNGGANSRAFVWSEAGGMTEVPLPTGTTTAGGRGINAEGWVVGTAASAFAIPFLYDGTQTYRLHDLMTIGGEDWDLQTGTSNGAFAIADNGTIVGRGLFNGKLTAFAMLRIVIDTDGDSIDDASDNCTLLANEAQRDTDDDGFGNVCDADFNNDNIVNVLDLGLLRSGFFGADPNLDMNGDGVVSTIDLGLLRLGFFQPPGPSGTL